jgi:uncharacterized protein (TIGR02594 family)
LRVTVAIEEEEMLGRRAFSAGLLSLPFALSSSETFARRQLIIQLSYPRVMIFDHETRSAAHSKASAKQIDRARKIIEATPSGPRPIDIAQTFIDRFYAKDPATISQLPAPAAVNPLIAAFFKGTSLSADRDVIPWCAAFANFCIDRNGKAGTQSASSQSFLRSAFKPTMEPKEGDLAIFTCFSPSTGKSLQLGHVAFFREKIDDNHIRVVGGNQSGDGHSSIISESVMLTSDRTVKRHLFDGSYVPTTMRLNTYVSLS